MIITVYSRTETFTERLDHYHTLDRLGQIIVLWNNPLVTPPEMSFDKYSIPVQVLKMDRNSLNNRFYPWPQIMYSCIVNMVSRAAVSTSAMGGADSILSSPAVQDDGELLL